MVEIWVGKGEFMEKGAVISKYGEDGWGWIATSKASVMGIVRYNFKS